MTKSFADVRRAIRSLATGRGVGPAIVAVLGISIGLVASIFAVADPYVLEPLPYREPDRLVAIMLSTRGVGPGTSLPTLADWQRRSDVFEDVAATRSSHVLRVRRLDDGTAAIRTIEVTRNLFRVLGLPEPAGWQEGGATTPLVLLDSGRARFPNEGTDRGRALPIEGGGSIRYVAALTPAFVFPDQSSGAIDALMPFDAETLIERRQASQSAASLRMIARLKAGVTLAAAGEAITATPTGERLTIFRMQTLDEILRSKRRPYALGALAAGLLLLVIAAINISHLYYGDRAARARELATRAALGATPWDLVRLATAEFGVLSAAGAAGSVVVARVALTVMSQALPREFATLGAPDMNGRVLIVVLGATLLVLLAGVVPVLTTPWIREGRRLTAMASQDGRTRIVQLAVAAGQCAVAMTLVTGAALLGRSYVNLVNQDTGFAPDAIAVSVSYPDSLKGHALGEEMHATIADLRRIPDVGGAAGVMGAMVNETTVLTIAQVNGKQAKTGLKSVTPDYFEVSGTRMLRGRPLTTSDGNGLGAVVNAAFAREFLPSVDSALGSSITMSRRTGSIVGVVADTFDQALDLEPTPEVFVLLEAPLTPIGATYVLRSSRTPEEIGPVVRRLLRDRADAVVIDVSRMGDRLTDSVRDRTFAAVVLGLFATTGVGISLAGILGVVTHAITRRTREIAIRVVVGARPRDVVLIGGDLLAAASAGIATGFFIGHLLARYLESLVYGIRPGDWVTPLAGAAALLMLVAVAVALPLRRAVQRQPIEALRAE